MAPYGACKSYEVEFADGGVTSRGARRKLLDSQDASGESYVFEVLSSVNRRRFGAVIRRRPQVKTVFLKFCLLQFEGSLELDFEGSSVFAA